MARNGPILHRTNKKKFLLDLITFQDRFRRLFKERAVKIDKLSDASLFYLMVVSYHYEKKQRTMMEDYRGCGGDCCVVVGREVRRSDKIEQGLFKRIRDERGNEALFLRVIGIVVSPLLPYAAPVVLCYGQSFFSPIFFLHLWILIRHLGFIDRCTTI